MRAIGAISILYQGYGMANLEWKQPVTPQTVFAVGSLTKPFTATAIMLLEKQGKLRLDDPIQKYLPDYPTSGYEITLWHLLTHTSGIPNFVTLPEFWEQHAATVKSVDEVIALFKDLPLDFELGTRYGYSNSGYVLLGCILERLLDTSYGESIKQLIFDPLGMTHSFLTQFRSPEKNGWYLHERFWNSERERGTTNALLHEGNVNASSRFHERDQFLLDKG
jgi:CubicO group peptidase (beta-lactamase class C family)